MKQFHTERRIDDRVLIIYSGEDWYSSRQFGDDAMDEFVSHQRDLYSWYHSRPCFDLQSAVMVDLRNRARMVEFDFLLSPRRHSQR
jgi:hypothetical protein